MTAFATARSLLFVPGDRPERIAKALASGADAVIVDLEDAVAAPDKAAARQAVATWLDSPESAPILLRINDAEADWHAADLALAAHPNVAGIVLPKATASALEALRRQTGKPLWPLIESASGLIGLPGLATLPGVARLLLGTIDLGLDLGLSPDHPASRPALDQARFQVVVASAAAGLPAPVDGVFTDIADEPGLAAEAAAAHARGMGAMMCIHPRQVAPVNAAMSPSQAEIDWADRVLAAAEGQKGAFSFEGRMIDKPILSRARRIAAQTGRS